MSEKPSVNEQLTGQIDLTHNNRFASLLQTRAALKERFAEVEKLLKSTESEIKDIIGNNESFICGDRSGTFRFEPRGEYQVRASNPRVLRIS